MKDKSAEAAAIFNRYASEYNEKFRDVSEYADALDHFCNILTPLSRKILDVACGPGNVAKYVIDRKPGYRIHGLDLSPEMIEIASRINPGHLFEVMDARAIKDLNEIYDGFIASFLVPYLNYYEVNKLFYNLFRLVKAGGAGYLSFMEGDPSASGYMKGSKGDLMYIHFYQSGYMIEQVNAAGFHVIYQTRKEGTMGDNVKVTDISLVIHKR